MRLLAESDRKSQFYYSHSFRECPLRFHAVRFPKVRPDGNRRRKEEGSGEKEDVVNPTVKSSFCRASTSWSARRQKRELPGQKYVVSCPSSCTFLPLPPPPPPFGFCRFAILFLWLFGNCSRILYFERAEEETDKENAWNSRMRILAPYIFLVLRLLSLSLFFSESHVQLRPRWWIHENEKSHTKKKIDWIN